MYIRVMRGNMETVEFEILRPVNPTGRSFIRYCYGAMAARRREVIDKYRREYVRLLQRLGYKIEDKIGSGKLITGKIIVEFDEEGKPIKVRIEELTVWEKTKVVNEPVEVELALE